MEDEGKIRGGSFSQTERVLTTLAAVIATAFIILLVFAIAAPATTVWRFATTALLSAIAALGFGGAVGLLFGLPTARPVRTEDGQAGWFAESTSLEQIADWLTKLIVAVSLTQFNTILDLVARLSAAITSELACGGQIACGPALGAAIISAFFILGLLTSYFWARRYLMVEFTTARLSAIDAARQSMSVALAKGAIQTMPGKSVGLSRELGSAADIGPIINRLRYIVPWLEPGPRSGDPWKDIYNERPARRTNVDARINALKTYPGLFEVKIDVSTSSDFREVERERPEIVFVLHPTFAEPVQTVPFYSGKASLTLIAWGAFALLIVLPDGTVREFDLAELPGAPDNFRNA